MTPSRSPSAPKPVKAWALVDNEGKFVEVAMQKDGNGWSLVEALGGGRCIRVTITPA